jgi:hypothetical protein
MYLSSALMLHSSAYLPILPSRCLNHSLHRNAGSDKHVMAFTSDKHVVMADRACKQKKGIQHQAENKKALDYYPYNEWEFLLWFLYKPR